MEFSSSPERDFRTKESKAIKNAAKVFPDPVGAEISTSRPAWISGHPSNCGSVTVGKRSVNQRRVRWSKRERGIGLL